MYVNEGPVEISDAKEAYLRIEFTEAIHLGSLALEAAKKSYLSLHFERNDMPCGD